MGRIVYVVDECASAWFVFNNVCMYSTIYFVAICRHSSHHVHIADNSQTQLRRQYTKVPASNTPVIQQQHIPPVSGISSGSSYIRPYCRNLLVRLMRFTLINAR